MTSDHDICSSQEEAFSHNDCISAQEMMANPGWIVKSGEGVKVNKRYACCSDAAIPTMEYLLNVR